MHQLPFIHQSSLQQERSIASEKSIASRIQSAIGQGQRLDQGVKQRLEQYLECDLSQVYVQRGREAHALARDCGAVAFTSGNQIFFQAGAYNPDTARGLRLLAHEVVHVIQQGRQLKEKHSSPQQVQWGVTDDETRDPYEQAAHLAAEYVLAGLPAGHLCAPIPHSSQPQGQAVLIQRHASWEHRLLGEFAPPLLNIIATVPNPITRRILLENLRDFLWVWHQDPEKVTPEQIRKKHPYIKTVLLQGSGLLVTYGELNTLPDFFANPASIDQQPKQIMLPILQAVRQEGYNNVQKLLQGEAATFQGAVGLNTGWGFLDLLMQMEAVDGLTWGLGINHSNHYKAVLGRNACHFAPYSWYRWLEFYTIARDLARQAYEAKSASDTASLTYQAWINHGYADHFLQDSFAAGHLINKTMVMQWFVEWVANQPTILVADWSQVKTMTPAQQPNLAAVGLYNWANPGTVRDPQTAEEQVTIQDRMNTCGVIGHYSQPEAYQNYLAFMNSTVIQASTASLHDHFNELSLWVTSASFSQPFQIWGDDTMLNGGLGVQRASETAQKSRQSIVELLNHGTTSITSDMLFGQFPTSVQDNAKNILPLQQWQMTQKSLAVQIFPDVHYYLLRAFPHLRCISQDFKDC